MRSQRLLLAASAAQSEQRALVRSVKRRSEPIPAVAAAAAGAGALAATAFAASCTSDPPAVAAAVAAGPAGAVSVRAQWLQHLPGQSLCSGWVAVLSRKQSFSALALPPITESPATCIDYAQRYMACFDS